MKTNSSKVLHESTAVATRPYSFPHEVIDDPSFSFSEKRAILSEWASDACAVESFPTLRLLPGTSFPVTYSAIMNAREKLESHILETEGPRPGDHAEHGARRVVPANFPAIQVFRNSRTPGPAT